MNTWTCPHCGEAIEDTFDTCWKCGTSRDGAPPADPALYDPATRDTLADPSYPEMVAPPSPPCPICHFTEFAWGRLDSSSKVLYRQGDGSLFGHSEEIRVRRCARCGNLQMFV